MNCPSGLFPLGYSDDKEYCIELKNRPNTDRCCVVLVCANGLSNDEDAAETNSSSHKENLVLTKTSGRALSGFNVQNDQPTTNDKNYKKKLKDLEVILNQNIDGQSKVHKKDNLDKFKGTKQVELNSKDESKSKLLDKDNVTTILPINEQDATTDESLSIMTTISPNLLEVHPSLIKGGEPAVIVEEGEDASEIHRITIHKTIDIVQSTDNPIIKDKTDSPVVKLDIIMNRTNEEPVVQTTTEFFSEPEEAEIGLEITTLLPMEDQPAREGKMVPGKMREKKNKNLLNFQHSCIII